ncbi:MAG: regulatory protein RecX [Pseudomonadota bacterium]
MIELSPGAAEAGTDKAGTLIGEEDSSEALETAYRAALDSAVRSLSQREHGRRELAQKLRRKGHPAILIDRVLDYLAEHDLQCDGRFAESFVYSRVQRGYGPIKIRQELGARGVAEGDLEAALTLTDEEWRAVAARVLERKFDGKPLDREDWATQARFLARRGFPSDVIYGLLGSQSDG